MMKDPRLTCECAPLPSATPSTGAPTDTPTGTPTPTATPAATPLPTPAPTSAQTPALIPTPTPASTSVLEGNGYDGDECCPGSSATPLPPASPMTDPGYLTTVYVDSAHGSDSMDGVSLLTAFATLHKAAQAATNSTSIYVANGTYHNANFGLGQVDNKAAISFRDLSHILLTNLPGHFPRIEFDGSAGISGMDMHGFEVRGFVIEGPSAGITHEEAMEDRLLHSNKFSGRGIVVWGGDHIHIHGNTIFHAPNSGILVDGGDYCTVEENVVFNNTWWSSNAESAIVFAEASSIDTSDEVKTVIRRNTVYGNVNRIPYYNSNYDDPAYLAANQMHLAREHYGSANQTFIIDGSGVYVSRNAESYAHGWFEISENVCYGNGINGLVVHKTDRALLWGNVLFNNGQVSKDPPQSRQPYAGLILNTANNVAVWNNTVSTTFGDDFACMTSSGSSFATAHYSGSNMVCIGNVDADFADKVETDARCASSSP